MSTPYKECPACGAHLDVGEPCDCQAAGSRKDAERAVIRPERDAYTHAARDVAPSPAALAERR